MQLDEWVALFVAQGMFRVRCVLCNRELFAQSRAKHARVVHDRLLSQRDVVHTRGKWQTKAALINTQPKKRKRDETRSKRLRSVGR